MTCSASVRLFVATNGDDAWSGRLPAPQGGDGPFATLERARDEVRKLKQAGAAPTGVTVEVAAGTYELARPFALTAQDGGTEQAPILYRARPGAEVRLVGGKVVQSWQPVTDPQVLDRLEESARGKVMQADLKALGLAGYGSVVGGGLELFFNDEPMTVSRWPKEGFVKIVDVVHEKPVDVRGTKGDMAGKFYYEGDRPRRWLAEKDLWLHGYWFWDWSDQRMKVKSIDPDKRLITLADPQHGYGYRPGQWYYALNALCEVSRPGEWYLDREAGILYFLPPSPLETGRAVVSVLPTLITVEDASFLTVRGFTLEACRDTAVTLRGGTRSEVVGCTIRNVGGGGVAVSGGTRNGVVGCDIYNTGQWGVNIDGGDRATLTPAGNFADNNHIHHFARWWRMYNAAVHVNGVGNRVSHNLMDNAPHTAIFFGGNDHLIEYNEIHSVCYESNDAGAIYSGRNWSMRGTLIRYNYLHDISGFQGQGCVGVYLDDMFCGTEIYGNLFYRVTMAAFIGGGRDNTIENNIFVDCNPATHVDARAMNWAKYHTDGWVKAAKETGLHEGIRYKEPPYSERWPELARVLDEDPWAPRGNLIARNVCWGGRWDNWEGVAKPMLIFQGNLVQVDPHFVDYEHHNFQLRDDSPAYAVGFERIPVEQIGLYADDRRASWPVTSAVQAAQTPPPPPPRPARGAPPVYRVARLATLAEGPMTLQQLGRAGARRRMTVAQGIEGEKVAPTSVARLAHDGTHLLVAIDNQVAADAPLSTTNTWGQDDAVELAFRNPALGKDAPIIILRGYPNGHFESSDEAGAPAAVVARALQGVQYRAAHNTPGHWTAEWSIPLASLGVDPAKHRKLAFNLSARKTAQSLWVEWFGTGGCTWEVDNAGFLDLAP